MWQALLKLFHAQGYMIIVSRVAKRTAQSVSGGGGELYDARLTERNEVKCMTRKGNLNTKPGIRTGGDMMGRGGGGGVEECHQSCQENLIWTNKKELNHRNEDCTRICEKCFCSSGVPASGWLMRMYTWFEHIPHASDLVCCTFDVVIMADWCLTTSLYLYFLSATRYLHDNYIKLIASTTFSVIGSRLKTL